MPVSTTDFVQKFALGLVSFGAIAFHTSPGFAQATIPNATEVCFYDTDAGMPNPLGMRAFVTAGQVGSDTVFVYEQFPAPVRNANSQNIRTDVSSRRTLTVYGTPIQEAREILANSPNSYAALLGIEGEPPGEDFGFAAVNNTLVCEAATANAPIPTEAPIPQRPATPPTAAPSTTFSDLPNGNYRVTSAAYPMRIVGDEELVENGGALFLFRKFGEAVTGQFSYIDSDIGACVTGEISGDRITGQAFSDDAGFSQGESTAVFLGPGGYLQLGQSNGGPRAGIRRYENASLNLEGFSRINAGSVLPPESCP